MIPVILSGGSGSRLWPQSRQAYPKQFLSLTSDSTLIQETVQRLAGLDAFAPLVICNEDHRFVVAEQLHQIGVRPDGILLEPCGRNTAPAVALAALKALRDHDDPLLLVLPADHVIRDRAAFHRAVTAAAEAARAGGLVTFGVVPDRAETGYGYIRRGAEQAGVPGAFAVERFVEKPDAARAADFVASGEYYWNSGMFLFRAARFVEELGLWAPGILDRCRAALDAARAERDFTWVDGEAFGECPSDSIDYAVMEKTASALVVPLDAGWSDVGSWQSLWEALDRDDSGNASRGEVLSIDSHNCLISSEKSLIAALGVDDLVIVESDDAILVTRRERSQDVKQVVNHLEGQGSDRHRVHRKVFRPWGHYDAIDGGERFQVKRIMVKPGERLSLQKHHHRAEHWIVVSGTALVTCGDKELLLTENQSTYIPLGVVHRLENPGKVELHIIEVQSGAYLGEDDIVRFDDAYGRTTR
ncbi:MAG: mannose-1-phosphate guanylyltransferase/mannose-6-phosphate isomerase [Porticoccaceae bacterium]|jgi:mannose-1-phosphate guanylyltransferase/mannose-6-phosphate isomerase|nr:mannose-1-phosphate guanylyltransferase/mannose-6-phosphate isomerase [Porticoccaceae bacterium]